MGIISRLQELGVSGLIITAAAILVSLTLHEIAHGFIALRLGDTTARDMGRLSLNPIKHIDIVGALFLLFVGFGWAKPVPVNPTNFQNNRDKGMALVGIAGPLCNLLQALVGGLVLLLLNTAFADSVYPALTAGSGAFYYLYYFLLYYIQINIVLMVFNLIPIPPLDGSRVLAGFLSPDLRFRYYKAEQFGLIIMLVLCLTGIIGYILNPPVSFLCNWIYTLAQVPWMV